MTSQENVRSKWPEITAEPAKQLEDKEQIRKKKN